MGEKPKFTPGPWRIDPDNAGDIQGAGGADANAHLLAASLELYEALAELVRCEEEPDFNGDAIDAAKRALAKARGEQADG